MNKLILINLCLFSCNSSKSNLEISYIEINEDAYIRLDSVKKKVVSLEYPIGINLKNVSSKSVLFSSITHWDYDIKSTKSSLLFKKENDSLIRISKTKYKKVIPQQDNIYVYYMQKSIDSNMIEQQSFSKYNKDLIIKNKVNIGSFNDFKKNNNSLIKKLTEKDTIFIRVNENNKIKTLLLPIN